MGGGAPPLSTQRYREEYLVDTETNEIIYPKVLSSSIVIPDSESDSISSIFTGSGIDKNTFINIRLDIAGCKAVANTRVVWKTYENFVQSYGWYLVCFQVYFNACTPTASKTYPNYDIALISNADSGANICVYKGFMDVSGYLRVSLANITQFTEDINTVQISTYSPWAFTVGSGNITIKAIKLFD